MSREGHGKTGRNLPIFKKKFHKIISRLHGRRGFFRFFRLPGSRADFPSPTLTHPATRRIDLLSVCDVPEPFRASKVRLACEEVVMKFALLSAGVLALALSVPAIAAQPLSRLTVSSCKVPIPRSR